WGSAGGGAGPKPASEPGIIDAAGHGLVDTLDQGARNVTKTITEGAQHLQNAAPGGASPNPLAFLKTLGETGLRTVGDVAGTAGELIAKPISYGIKTVADKLGDI